MTAPGYDARAVYRDGEVRYPDAESVRRDIGPFLRHQVLWVRCATAPPLVTDLDLRLHLPTGAAILVRGRVLSQAGDSAAVQLKGWPEGAWALIQEAASAPPPRESERSRKSLAPASEPVESARSLYERRRAGSLFDALGVHYSAPPSVICAAHARVLAAHGPGSPGAQAAPEDARRLVDLANKAFSQLADSATRRQLRRDLGFDIESAALLAASQAKLVRARGDLDKARELYETAVDLHPIAEYREALRHVEEPIPEIDPDAVDFERPPKRGPG